MRKARQERSEGGTFQGGTFENNISTMQTEAQRGRAISTWDVNTVDTIGGTLNAGIYRYL